MLIGYARVSTQDQDTALQLEAMRAAGVDKVFEEKASGAKIDRPVLWECLDSLRSGDQFVFYKLDRVARSLSDLLKIVDCVERAGAWCVVSNRSRQHAFSIILMSSAWSARPGRAPGGSRHGRPGGGHQMCFFACPRASLSGQFRAGQLGAIRGACIVTVLHASSRAGKRRALLLA